MQDQLRFIQVGLGGFGKTWCKDIVPKVAGLARPVAAVDVDPATFENPVKYYGLPREKCYTDLEKALDENEADFVALILPPQFREEATDLAVARGLHLLCEKPYAQDMATCCRLYKKVTDAGLKMVVTMSHRMSRDKQSLQAYLESGRYGAVGYLVGRLAMARRRTRGDSEHGPGHNRGTLGLLSEGAVHQLDILRVMSGANAKTVYARGWANNWNAPGAEADSVFVTAGMENGVEVFCEQSYGNAAILNEWGQDHIRAECDRATLVLDNRAITARSALGFPQPAEEQLPMLPGGEDAFGHFLLMQNFVDWVRGGPEPPCSLRDNLQAVALTYAAQESIETGGPVDVQAFLKRHMEANGGR